MIKPFGGILGDDFLSCGFVLGWRSVLLMAVMACAEDQALSRSTFEACLWVFVRVWRFGGSCELGVVSVWRFRLKMVMNIAAATSYMLVRLSMGFRDLVTGGDGALYLSNSAMFCVNPFLDFCFGPLSRCSFVKCPFGVGPAGWQIISYCSVGIPLIWARYTTEDGIFFLCCLRCMLYLFIYLFLISDGVYVGDANPKHIPVFPIHRFMEAIKNMGSAGLCCDKPSNRLVQS